jgi:hypothetical protein
MPRGKLREDPKNCLTTGHLEMKPETTVTDGKERGVQLSGRNVNTPTGVFPDGNLLLLYFKN